MPKALYLLTLPVNRPKGLPTMIAYVHGERFEIFYTKPEDMTPVVNILKSGSENDVTDEQLKETKKLVVPTIVIDDLVKLAEAATKKDDLFEAAWKKIEPFVKNADTINLHIPVPPVKVVVEPKDAAAKEMRQRQQQQQQRQPQRPQRSGRTAVVFPLIPELNSNIIRFKTTLDKITGVGEVKDQKDRCVLFVGPSAKFVVAKPYAVVDKAVFG